MIWRHFVAQLSIEAGAANQWAPQPVPLCTIKDSSKFMASLSNPFWAFCGWSRHTGIKLRYKLDHLRFKVWEQVEAAGVVYAEAAI